MFVSGIETEQTGAGLNSVSAAAAEKPAETQECVAVCPRPSVGTHRFLQRHS